MGVRDSTVVALGGHGRGLVSCYAPNQVCSERIRRPCSGSPKAQFPPGNAQAKERQTVGRQRGVPQGLLESGGSVWSPPTEGERRVTRLISQVTGQKGGGRPAWRGTAAFFIDR